MQNWYEKYQKEKQKEKGKLFSIRYKRDVKGTEHTTILTPDNCNEFDYTAKEYTYNNNDIIISGYVYQNNSTLEIADYEVDENSKTITTAIEAYNQVEYTHQAPACSDFKVSLADVHKEGSGRNDINGIMLIDRIGSYSQIEVTWNLIPNTEEYNNWYVVLSHLPPKFNIYALFPDGVKRDVEVYRGDVSTSLYWFLDENHQMWQGLSTTFIQANVDPYDDTYEPNVNDKQTVIRNYEVVLGEYNTDLKKKIFNYGKVIDEEFGQPSLGINANNRLVISDKYSVFSDVYIKYVTCEPNYTILDNDFRFCDNINEIANNSGIITNEISNSSNELPSNVTITIYNRMVLTPDNCTKYNCTYKLEQKGMYGNPEGYYYYYTYYKNGIELPKVNARIIRKVNSTRRFQDINQIVPYYYNGYEKWVFSPDYQSYHLSENDGYWTNKNVDDYLNSLTEEQKNTPPLGYLDVYSYNRKIGSYKATKDGLSRDIYYINDNINKGITITFFEVCENFSVDFYNVNKQIITSKEISNNKSLEVKVFSDIENSEDIDYITITLKKSSKPLHRIRIKNIDFGIKQDLLSEELVSIDIIRETSLYNEENCSNEINFVINDSQKIYDENNPFNEINNVSFGTKAKVYYVENNGVEKNKYLLATESIYNTEYDYSRNQLKVQGNSIDYFLDNNPFLSNFYSSVNIESIVCEVFNFYKLNANNFVIDNSLKDITLTGYIPQSNFIECLSYVCKAVNGYYFEDKNGKIVIKKLENNDIVTNMPKQNISSFNLQKETNNIIDYVDVASYYYEVPEYVTSDMQTIYEGKLNKGLNYVGFNQIVKSYDRYIKLTGTMGETTFNGWFIYDNDDIQRFKNIGIEIQNIYANGLIIKVPQNVTNFKVEGFIINEHICYYRFYPDLSYDILSNEDNISQDVFDNKFISVEETDFGNERGAEKIKKTLQYIFNRSNYTYDLSTKFDHKFELGDKKIVHTEFGEDVITINKIEIDGSLIEKIGGK